MDVKYSIVYSSLYHLFFLFKSILLKCVVINSELYFNESLKSKKLHVLHDNPSSDFQLPKLNSRLVLKLLYQAGNSEAWLHFQPIR